MLTFLTTLQFFQVQLQELSLSKGCNKGGVPWGLGSSLRCLESRIDPITRSQTCGRSAYLAEYFMFWISNKANLVSLKLKQTHITNTLWGSRTRSPAAGLTVVSALQAGCEAFKGHADSLAATKVASDKTGRRWFWV